MLLKFNQIIFFYQACTAAGGTCEIRLDGYYIECVICLVYGLIWYQWGRHKINYLQNLPTKAWHVVRRTEHSKR